MTGHRKVAWRLGIGGLGVGAPASLNKSRAIKSTLDAIGLRHSVEAAQSRAVQSE